MRESLDEILGSSAGMAGIRARIRRLLDRPSTGHRLPPVLIEGETGTGKSMIARIIHEAGPRAGRPFVAVDGAAIPETLLEAELFGYERGAFTDARQAKPGLFHVADGGTIFLDEIGLLPAGLQVKLLHVLQERTVRRLGGTRSEPVDVQVFAATNEDLLRLTRAKRFREDLYHRLAVLTLKLPPLRERPEDVPALAEHFLARACREYGLTAKTLTGEAQAALAAYGWPGNVRELDNVMERVAMLVDDAEVTAAQLGLPAASVRDPVRTTPRLPDAVQDLERRHVLDALGAVGWNITRAAARLGITRNRLRYRIEKYRLIPPVNSPAAEAASQALPQPAANHAESRRVTFLSAVLAGAPSASPASARAVELLVEKAESFGGRVETRGADGIVASFGAEPLEDAPRRAVHAAMAMQKSLERAARATGAVPGLRLGIHAAAVAVGPAGESRPIAPVALEAARSALDCLADAEPGPAILVSGAAAPLLLRRFDLDPLDADRAGGVVYRIAGDERRGPAGGRRTSFVGRGDELRLLRTRVIAVMRGQGQVVGIVGDAGVGKSRLLLELRQALRGEDITWMRGRCLSHGSVIPYFLIVDVLRQTFRITEADNVARLVARVEAGLRLIDLPPDVHAPLLLHLLGVNEATAQLAALSDEAVKRSIYETLRGMLVCSSRLRPIVYAVEDLHWIDRASEECLAFLVEHLAGGPILLLTTYRPGYRPPWVARSDATQIALPPLPPEDSAALVASALGARQVPDDVVRAIVDKGDGNPFFLEEISRASGEAGATPLTIPDTIQEVLLARIDRLPPDARRFLQMVSVLGREVSPRLLERLWDGPAGEQLDVLTRLELLQEQRRRGDTVYVFKHTLTQEVAYATLSPEERARLHEAAGRALETAYAGRLSEVVDSLAWHFARTALTDKAIAYLTDAAERAARSDALDAAVAALDEALIHAGRLPAESRERRTLELFLRQAPLLVYLGRVQEALDLLVRHRERVEALGDPRLAGHYHFLLGRTWSLLGEAVRALDHERRAIAEAGRVGDTATMGKAHSLLALDAPTTGHSRQGLEHGREAIALLERTSERWWLGHTHWAMALNHAQTGEFEPALAAAGRAHAIAEAIGDARLTSYAGWVTGIIYASIGEGKAGVEACGRALEAAPDPLSRAIAAGWLGYAWLESEDVARAAPLLERALQQLRRFRYRAFHGWFAAILAEAARRAGDLGRAGDLATEALTVTREVSFRVGIGWSQQALGRIALARRAFGESAAHLTAACKTFEAIHSRYELARTYLDRATLAHAQADRAATAASLKAAHRLFATLGVPRYVERTAHRARQVGIELGAGG